MTVMMPGEKWTDERLDDLNKKVGEVGGLRGEMNARFESIDARFDKLNESINARFDAQNRNLIGAAVAIVAALIGVNVLS